MENRFGPDRQTLKEYKKNKKEHIRKLRQELVVEIESAIPEFKNVLDTFKKHFQNRSNNFLEMFKNDIENFTALLEGGLKELSLSITMGEPDYYGLYQCRNNFESYLKTAAKFFDNIEKTQKANGNYQGIDKESPLGKLKPHFIDFTKQLCKGSETKRKELTLYANEETKLLKKEAQLKVDKLQKGEAFHIYKVLLPETEKNNLEHVSLKLKFKNVAAGFTSSKVWLPLLQTLLDAGLAAGDAGMSKSILPSLIDLNSNIDVNADISNLSEIKKRVADHEVLVKKDNHPFKHAQASLPEHDLKISDHMPITYSPTLSSISTPGLDINILPIGWTEAFVVTKQSLKDVTEHPENIDGFFTNTLHMAENVKKRLNEKVMQDPTLAKEMHFSRLDAQAIDREKSLTYHEQEEAILDRIQQMLMKTFSPKNSTTNEMFNILNPETLVTLEMPSRSMSGIDHKEILTKRENLAKEVAKIMAKAGKIKECIVKIQNSHTGKYEFFYMNHTPGAKRITEIRTNDFLIKTNLFNKKTPLTRLDLLSLKENSDFNYANAKSDKNLKELLALAHKEVNRKKGKEKIDAADYLYEILDIAYEKSKNLDVNDYSQFLTTLQNHLDRFFDEVKGFFVDLRVLKSLVNTIKIENKQQPHERIERPETTELMSDYYSSTSRTVQGPSMIEEKKSESSSEQSSSSSSAKHEHPQLPFFSHPTSHDEKERKDKNINNPPRKKT
ncbi:MAG: hypothetical protein JO149_04155 [Gammaproteobacteria bacterium]|nr:hypothetical protein [Gammaproteobacteria bacterium]